MKLLLVLQQWIKNMLDNQFILEVKYLDSIKRVKKKKIVGVFPTLDSIEKVKQKLLNEVTDYTLYFSISPQFNPFLHKIA